MHNIYWYIICSPQIAVPTDDDDTVKLIMAVFIKIEMHKSQ